MTEYIDEEKYTTLDTEQCKWWVNTLFSIAKEKACNSHNFDDGEEMQAAQDKIIKALEQQPSEDCVSRTQAIEWIENLRQMDKCFGNYEDDYFPLSEVIDRLKNVPPVTPTFPKGATNGDIIKAMFPDAEIDYHEKSDLVDSHVTVFIKDCDTCQDYSYDWWNTPYKRGNENDI